jgi:hypothetical protein
VLTEVLYKAPELGHRMAPDELHAALLGSGIAVEPVTEADVLRAAELILTCRASQSGRSAASRSVTACVSPSPSVCS